MSKFVEGDYVKHTRIGVIGHIDDNGICLVTFIDGKEMIHQDDLIAVPAAGAGKTIISIQKLKDWIGKNVGIDSRELLNFIEREGI